ncbi:hypothetical protein PS627_03062 [Pseudomonas fluorescens]|uniref:threonine/serine exporter family protein n=1 Tax=Pseudomonas fluorescens TaxID=294 RepID=UPI001258517B|nr:threonine/serine exporter family protein [Pseudomonas fluorescens]CAG8868512.1 hypothetical protein PS627_03062 [Pseudomonas fluorescens]
MTPSEIEQLNEHIRELVKEQLKICQQQHQLQLRELQAKLNVQEKYPYGPWREFFSYPVLLAFVCGSVSVMMGVGIVELASLIK